MLDIIKDTLIDAIKLIPFLFIAFYIIELLEHKFSSKTQNLITNSKKVAPLIGSILGIFPQCGFSVMATNLYVTRIISIGTLIAVYLSTSDEMLPIMLSRNVELPIILKILAIKLTVGMIIGFLIDYIAKKITPSNQPINLHICEEEHCHCEKSLLKSSLKHTMNILIFLLIVTFILNFAIEYIGTENLSKIFLKDTPFAPFISSLIGLIPNCAASVTITELYLTSTLSLGSAIAGLLTGSGVAILVLFKSNKNKFENLTILAIIYFTGALTGLLINLITTLI